MRLIDRFKKFALEKLAKSLYATPTKYVYRIPSSGATSSGTSMILSDSDFLSRYVRIIWAFQGIHTIATAAAQVPLRLFYSTGTMKVEILSLIHI